MSRRLIIAGTRYLDTRHCVDAAKGLGMKRFGGSDELPKSIMINHFGDPYFFEEIVSGNSGNVDLWGERVSLKILKNPAEKFPADWDRHGNSAGPIRNRDMARYASNGAHPSGLLAIWDGKSRGTENMMKWAHYYGLVVICYVPGPFRER